MWQSKREASVLLSSDCSVPFESTGQWFVIHTKTRQEKAFGQALAAMNVPCFLPLISKVCYYGRRKNTVQVPLFPGYVFLRGELDDAYSADRTKRVVHIIRVVDQERIHRELWSLYLALTQDDAPLDPFPYLTEGIWAEVQSGPFQGLQGIVEKRDCRDNRIILQIETLGQATSLEIDGSLVEPLE